MSISIQLVLTVWIKVHYIFRFHFVRYILSNFTILFNSNSLSPLYMPGIYRVTKHSALTIFKWKHLCRKIESACASDLSISKSTFLFMHSTATQFFLCFLLRFIFFWYFSWFVHSLFNLDGLEYTQPFHNF